MEVASLTAPASLAAPRGGRLLRLRSDDQLVVLFRQGNDDAFRVIHDRYRLRLLAYTRQMLAGSHADAEDALQDVFLRAYGTLRADGRPVTLRAWLYRVAHNRCIDHMRRPANQACAELQDGTLAGPRGDPWTDLQHRDDLRQLVADVRRLPDQQRSALLMREMEGLAYAELSDALGVSLPAVKSLLVRARIGLVEAREARDTACVEIREDVAAAHDRGVKVSARARRHLHECSGCEEYRSELRRVREGFAALGAPASGWGLVAKLLGLGGAGSGAAATAGGGGGGAVASGLLAAGGTAKVAALVCCAAVVGGGAIGASRELSHLARPAAAAAAQVHRAGRARPQAPRLLPAALVARRVEGPVAATAVVPPAAAVTAGLVEAPDAVVAPDETAGWGDAGSGTVLEGADGGDALTADTAGGALAPADAADPEPLAPAGGPQAGAPATGTPDHAGATPVPAGPAPTPHGTSSGPVAAGPGTAPQSGAAGGATGAPAPHAPSFATAG